MYTQFLLMSSPFLLPFLLPFLSSSLLPSLSPFHPTSLPPPSFLLPPSSSLPPLQDVKLYEEVTSLEEFTSIVETSLEEYNNMHKNRMNLVIFRYVQHFQLNGHPLPLIPSLSIPPGLSFFLMSLPSHTCTPTHALPHTHTHTHAHPHTHTYTGTF